MRINLKKVMSGVAACALAASVGPFLTTSAANAAPAGTAPEGSLTMTPSSGDSQQDFVLDPADPQVCPGDGATDGYRWQTYFVDSANDPATLIYGSTGPDSDGTTGWVSALFTPAGSPVVNQNPDIGTANISGIPVMDFSVFGPGTVPAGEYYIGIACTLGGVTETFWQLPITITTNAGDGASNIDYSVGARPSAPADVAAIPGNQECTVTFTGGVAEPPTTEYTATANPGGATATGADSPLTITGLTNSTVYDITVTATNSVGTSDPSAAVSCTPSPGPRTNVTGLTATPGAPGSGNATVDWTQPGPNDPPATPTGCEVAVSGPTPSTQTVPCSDETLALSGLAEGSYTVAVTAQYADAPTTGTPEAVAPFTINPAQVVLQDIDVTRPVGNLVLTQVCGTNGLIPAVPADTYPGFATGLPEANAVDESLVGAPTTGGTAPTLTEDGADSDPARADYPYPTDANGVPAPNYPTHCGLDLGTADFVTSGPGAGQFFAADGILNQVTIVDTRDDDLGWTVTGTMGQFSANGDTDHFSGSQLGWVPKDTVDGQTDTGAFTDSDGNTYNQTVSAGTAVAPNTANASGLSSGQTLASAGAAAGLGTAILDARLLLLIPVTADAGDYEGTLTLTVA